MVDNFITKELHTCFPNIGYWNSIQTSEVNNNYNCIA
jgi:hypothetical protein